jgi:Bacterial regulatory helix-turn-helix protein, lysR family
LIAPAAVPSRARDLALTRTLGAMDHSQLRQFVAAAQQLHFAPAARELGIPRPTLIATIRAMEAQLGYELFDTAATSTQLTPEGEALLVDAKRQLDTSTRAAAASAAKPGGKAKASKGKGRAPAVKGERKPGRPRQGR